MIIKPVDKPRYSLNFNVVFFDYVQHQISTQSALKSLSPKSFEKQLDKAGVELINDLV